VVDDVAVILPHHLKHAVSDPAYQHFTHAWQQLSHWLEIEYMAERIHSSLGYLTPAKFETAFSINQMPS